MKIFGAVVALVSAQWQGPVMSANVEWPSPFDTSDHFWLSAATESRNGAGGVAQINTIRCNRSINIKVSRDSLIKFIQSNFLF